MEKEEKEVEPKVITYKGQTFFRQDYSEEMVLRAYGFTVSARKNQFIISSITGKGDINGRGFSMSRTRDGCGGLLYDDAGPCFLEISLVSEGEVDALGIRKAFFDGKKVQITIID